MKINRNSIALGIFGVCTIASGLYRFLSREGGNAGLWFGLIMGTIALGSAVMFALARPIAGHLLAWTSIVFVGGWFVYEALIKNGWSNAEPRMLFIILVTFVAAVLLVLPQFPPRSA